MDDPDLVEVRGVLGYFFSGEEEVLAMANLSNAQRQSIIQRWDGRIGDRAEGPMEVHE